MTLKQAIAAGVLSAGASFTLFGLWTDDRPQPAYAEPLPHTADVLPPLLDWKSYGLGPESEKPERHVDPGSTISTRVDQSPTPIQYVERTFTITAYCQGPCCCGPSACGITASGKPVTANGGLFVAADRSLPFGTMIAIPGYASGRPVPVLDRGGAIRGARLDLYFSDHQTAIRWGVKTLTVRIYRPASR